MPAETPNWLYKFLKLYWALSFDPSVFVFLRFHILPTSANKAPMQKPEIQFDDFAKLEMKAATVISCEKVAKADKLLKLEVDLGTEKRTIVSGIALHYTPEEMVGKQVIVVTNLAPRKMKGIESQGMILTAEDSDGKLQLLRPENGVAPGSGVS